MIGSAKDVNKNKILTLLPSIGSLLATPLFTAWLLRWITLTHGIRVNEIKYSLHEHCFNPFSMDLLQSLLIYFSVWKIFLATIEKIATESFLVKWYNSTDRTSIIRTDPLVITHLKTIEDCRYVYISEPVLIATEKKEKGLIDFWIKIDFFYIE